MTKPNNYIIDHPSEDELHADVVDLSDPPLISICIPTYNDEATLETCLQSFANQQYSEMEIIIVDGYSEDNTINIAEQYADEIFYEDGLLGEARQKSFQESNGEIVALFDGDITLPHDNWIRQAIQLFNYDETVSTVWPRNIAPPNGTLTTRLYFNHWDEIMESRIANNRGFFGGGNSLFRREPLEEIGGVNPDIHWGEDFDWAKRLAERGYKVVYNRDSVYHDTMQSLSRFTRKQFTGAETFSKSGFGLMGLTMKDVLFEQYILGIFGMIKGLALDRDVSWLMYPAYISLRSVAYGYTFLQSLRIDTK